MGLNGAYMKKKCGTWLIINSKKSEIWVGLDFEGAEMEDVGKYELRL